MKKTAIILLSSTLLISSAFAKVVATYKDGNITSQDVMKKFKPMLQMQPKNKDKKFFELDKDLQEILVKAFINQKLALKEAKRLKIRDTKEFKEKTAEFKKQLLHEQLIQNHLKKAITDKMIDAEYQKIVDSLKDKKEIKTSHILVDTKKEADEIKRRIDKGTKFEDISDEVLNDDNPKSTSGELGYVKRGQLVPEFEAKLFAMKKGEISDVVKTQFGYHIIKRFDSRPVKIPAKKEVESRIKDKLSSQEIKKYFDDLEKKARVELKI